MTVTSTSRGSFKILVLEATEQRGRRFDQVGHFVEQRVVFQHVPADALPPARHLIGDGGAARRRCRG